MKILVTGGSGYIGSHTCVELVQAGYEVVALDNLCNSKSEAVNRTRELAGNDFPFYECDIRDAEGLEDVFARENIGLVIHFAGLKAVGESVRQPLDYYDNNLNGAVTLLRTMDKIGCKKIIFSSSATVYGEENPIPYVETMKTGGATSPYGQTKCMIEQVLFDLCRSDPEWTAVLLRYFNPIGAHESGRIGEDPSGIPNNLMPFISQVAVGKRDCLPVFGNNYPTPDGTCIRDYIHVVDLARGHVAAVQYAFAHTGAEPINLGTGRGTSVLELIHAFEKANQVHINYRIDPPRAGDIPAFYACAEKAKELLGWTAEYSIEQMCRDSWNWQKNNPDGYGD